MFVDSFKLSWLAVPILLLNKNIYVLYSFMK